MAIVGQTPPSVTAGLYSVSSLYPAQVCGWHLQCDVDGHDIVCLPIL